MIFFINSCYKESIIFNGNPNQLLELPLILKINNKHCNFDHTTNTLRYSISHTTIEDFEAYVEFQDYSEVYFNNTFLDNNTINNFGKIEINKNYNITIVTQQTTHQFTLQFTTLPTIQIISNDQIIDEPKTLARIIINYPNIEKNSTMSYIGIEYRGGSSQSYVKKSFGFSFLNSSYINDVSPKSIFELAPHSQWCLDALYIDNSRLRNKTSFEIWKNMNPQLNYAINSSFVELYINNDYHGLYCIHELINGEFIGLYSNDAVLYKAVTWNGTTFETYSEQSSNTPYWDGWEQKFPIDNQINWEPLHTLRDAILNYSDDEFVSEINKIINIDNIIDYYIFLNLIAAYDNSGKNTFLARKSKKDPLFIIPWDLEGSNGINWDGSQSSYDEILTNNLYNRLLYLNPDGFKQKIKNRWVTLREESLNTNTLIHMFESNFMILSENDIIEKENNVIGSDINMQQEQDFIQDWLINRTSFLDNYYINL